MLLGVSVSPVLMPQTAHATTTGFYATNDDGYTIQTIFSTTYLYTWNYAIGIPVAGFGPSGEYAKIGQQKLGASDFAIARGFFYFNTSSLPDGATITGATLKLWGSLDYSDTDFNLVIQNGQPTYPHSPLEGGDHNRLYYDGNGGSVSTSGFTTSGYNNITLNATGLTWISKTSTTKLAVRSSRDIDGTAPTGNELVNVYTSEYAGASARPYLEITYSLPPTVTSSAATLVTATTATLNATLTSIGDNNCTERGFEWGTASGTYTSNWTETPGPYGVGTFSHGLTLLTDSTTYYFRALAINAVGTAYGGELSFTTSSFTLSVQTNHVGNLAPTSALLQGTLLDLGGASFASVFFEYGTTTSYGSQTEEITVVTVGTFNQTVTGLRYNATYHYRAVARYGTAYFYGADEFFTTLTSTGSSTDLVIVSAKAFQNYQDTGDMLFVAECINTYTGYYPSESVVRFFTLQLIDTNGSTVLGAAPLAYWGDRPISIYVNDTQAVGLVAQESYYIKLIGTGIPAQPSVTYQLQDADWKGYDLTELDKWVIATATNMQLSDNEVYLERNTDVGIVLTDEAGAYFSKGIPGLSRVRPNLFATIRPIADIPDNTPDPKALTGWQNFVGPNIAADATILGIPFGVSGDAFIGTMMFFVMLGFVMVITASTGGFGALGAAMICLPILWLGTYFEVIPVAILTALLLACAAAWIRQFVVKTL